VRRSRHAGAYDLKEATRIARVADYVARSFPCAAKTRDGKMPCGPSNDVMSRDLQFTRQLMPSFRGRALYKANRLKGRIAPNSLFSHTLRIEMVLPTEGDTFEQNIPEGSRR
jgi:hypothetical protein